MTDTDTRFLALFGGDYLHPDWGNNDWRCHNWRNYISPEVQEMWDTFTPEQKRAIAGMAADSAGKEEWD